jgi:hypothetical protein
MHLIVTHEVQWLDIPQITVINSPSRYFPGVHQIAQPVATIAFYFVVVGYHPKNTFANRPAQAARHNHARMPPMTPFRIPLGDST